MRKGVVLFMVLVLAVAAGADTPRERYDAADYSINEGNGYKEYNNENATLAWGESYILTSYISAYLGTADTVYLDKLCDHADHVLAQRDDARGVVDYRDVSGACWRNLYYQPNDEPYCYTVHSGMITYPMAAFVDIVRGDESLHDLTTYDGLTYLEKADAYATAIYETLAFHEDQWVDVGDAGYYIFRADATFLTYAGRDLPLNQGNALGRTILALGLAEDDADLLARAERMARWFDDQLRHVSLDNVYLWNYWGGIYVPPGEDISHAVINADFARLCGEAGIVFNDEDRQRFANTFSWRIYFSSEKFYKHIGGVGAYNEDSYTKQIGRWLGYTPDDATVYSATRNYYDALDPTAAGSGSVILGFANVLRYDLPERTEWYFTIDGWEDQGEYRVPVSDEAGIYFLPDERAGAVKIALTYEAAALVKIEQGDSENSEIIARFGITEGESRTLFFAHHPEWLAENDGYGALFLLHDVDKVYEGSAMPTPAVITGVPPETAMAGEAFVYQAVATGTRPMHWAATIDGEDAAMDRLTGELTHTFAVEGVYEVVVTAVNTGGTDEQSFTLTVLPAADDDAADDDVSDDDADDDVADDDIADDDSIEDGDDDDDDNDSADGCGC